MKVLTRDIMDNMSLHDGVLYYVKKRGDEYDICFHIFDNMARYLPHLEPKSYDEYTPYKVTIITRIIDRYFEPTLQSLLTSIFDYDYDRYWEGRIRIDGPEREGEYYKIFLERDCENYGYIYLKLDEYMDIEVEEYIEIEDNGAK